MTEKWNKNFRIFKQTYKQHHKPEERMQFGKKIIPDAVGVAMRTTAEVHKKWKSLSAFPGQERTKEFTELSKEKKNTDKVELFHNQDTSHIGNYSGNSGLTHTEGVAYIT